MKIQTEQQMLEILNDYIDYVNTSATKSINYNLPFTVLSHSFEERSITYAFETADWMQNPYGTVHGGMITTMLDLVMGVTTRAFCGNFTSTVNLSVNFLNPVPLDDIMTVKTTATQVGGTFIQMTAEATVQSTGKLCATGSAAFYCHKNISYRNTPVE